jgi:hypothetical protein
MKTIKQFALMLLGFFGMLFGIVTPAAAAVPAAVTTALGDLKTDTETVAGLAFAAFLVIVLFAYMLRASH